MNVRWITPAVAAACLATVPLAAQDALPRGDTIDLARAVGLARAASPRIGVASGEAVAAGARVGPAGALPDPRVTLGIMNRMMPGFTTGDPVTMNQITLIQSVPISGVLGKQRAAARFDSTRTSWSRQAVVLDVERDVRARYWDLYHTDRALDIMDRTLGVLRDLATISATMYSVGQASQSDVLRAQVAVTRMQQEVAEMRLRRFRSAVALNVLMARAPAAPIVLPPNAHVEHGGLPESPALPPLPPLDSLELLADSGNPDLLANGAAVHAAEATESAAHKLLYPDLELGVAYGRRQPSDDMLSLMVGVSVPLFARSRQLRVRDEARALRDVAGQVLRERRLDVHGRLAAAQAEAQTARAQRELYLGSLLPQARASYEAALSAYRVGRVDFPTVLDAQMALLQYQHDLHGYEALFGTAVAEIDRLIGRPFGVMPWDRQEIP